MVRYLKLQALAAGVLCLANAGTASAQFFPGGANMAGANSQAFARGLAGAAVRGAVNNFAYNPYAYGGGYGGYGGGITQQVATPWSTSHGAWITQAPGFYAANDIAAQQATLSAKQGYQDLELRRLQLKRAAFDEMRYEKMNTPPPEVVREEHRMERLSRARNTPPRDEIVSGEALNVLLNNIERIQVRENITGTSIPLDPETLKNINVTTTGDSSGSNEFFKPGGFPDWPYAFSSNSFDDAKKSIQSDLNDLAKAQIDGKVDNAKAARAKRTAEGMKSMLFDIRSKVSFNDYVAALEFLSKLTGTVETLSKPGAKGFFDGTYSAKGKDVAELVTNMNSKGLKFGLSTPGLEPYYMNLYQQLVTYEISLSRMAGQSQTSMMQQQWPPPMKN